MKSIPSEYIKTFIPIQELDELKAASGQLVTIHPDDLFLMSQISAYASGSSSAVAVSKKINYKNFSEKLSDDFSIGGIKLSVAGKIQPIYDLSSQLRQTSTYLSDSIDTSVLILKNTINTVSSSLSSTVENDYIKNYGSQTCCLIEHTDDPSDSARLATNITLENGKITGIAKDSLSNLLVPKDWHIAYGGIAGDMISSYPVNVDSDAGVNSIQQIISNDCYVNCLLSAKEDDSYGPLQVWISSGVSNASALYATLNNPGGFSGNDYFNYYNFSIPLKGFSGAKIIVKYADGKNIKKGSSAKFDCYYYYAVPSKDELSSYAKKSSIPASDPTPKVYKMTYGEGGVIQTTTSVYYGAATNSNAGLVKVNQLFATPKYGLMISSNGYGYVEVSSATSSTYGTIKYTYTTDSTNDHHHFINTATTSGKLFLACGLESNSTGNALTFIPCADNTTLGVVKLNPNAISVSNNVDNPLSTYLGVDSSGCAYTTIPYAHYDQNGYPIPGIMKPGYPDTTSIRVVRNVYLNKNGVACVNVANQIGIGPYVENEISGFTKCITISLNNPTPVNQFNQPVKAFNGHQISCSEYGDYVFSVSKNINGWFMAELMYESDGDATYAENSGLQIICDGIIVTTINPLYEKTANGKKFMYSTQLGVFKGGSESGSMCIFGAISNTASFGNDKIHFLVKEMSNS